MPHDEDGHIRAAIAAIESDHAKRPHDGNRAILLRLRQAEDLVKERDADQAREDAITKPTTKPTTKPPKAKA